MPENVRILIHPARNRFLNMAIDEALLRLCRQPVLRFYRWSEPDAISIGYFQASSDVPARRPFVRRYTGGGLVDHTADFTYSVILPKQHALSLAGTAQSYEQIHAPLADALKKEGFDVRLAPSADPVESSACFQKAVRFDVVAREGKVAGAAQRRTREGCLHQGSVLVSNFNFQSLCYSVAEYLIPVLGAGAEESALTEEESARAATLETERYATELWNHSKK